MITYKMEKLAPGRYKVSALDGGEVVVYGTFRVFGKKALGLKFVHAGEFVPPELIKGIIAYGFEQMEEKVETLLIPPTKNGSILSALADSFGEISFSAGPDAIEAKTVKSYSYEGNLSCSNRDISKNVSAAIKSTYEKKDDTRNKEGEVIGD